MSVRVRYLQIGDLHLAPGPRQVDRLDALDQIIRYGESIARELGGWLIPGDIYHTESTVEDRNAIKERLIQMGLLAPVLIVKGNHDAPGDLAILADLKARYPIRVATSPQFVMLDRFDGIPAQIFCLPYPDRAMLVAAQGADVFAAALVAFRPIFLDAADYLAKARERGDIAFSIGHINIGGSVASTGQPQIGREIELDPELAQMVAPLFLNHIHKHQVVHGAVYAGSVCRLDYGENEPKGFLDITWTRDGDDEPWQSSWQFIELDVPRQLLINGRLTPTGYLPDGIADADALIRIPGSHVRLRYRYLKAEFPMLDVAGLDRLGAGARSFKPEPEPIREGDVRAPEIIQATTLEEKVRHYCARVGVEWSDGLTAKVEELQNG